MTTTRRVPRRSDERLLEGEIDRIRRALDESSDLASAIHLDPEVVRWTSEPRAVPGHVGGELVVQHVPDFVAWYRDGRCAAIDLDGIVGFVPVDPTLRYVDAAVDMQLDAVARRNLRLIMSRYRSEVSARDRMRVLAFLDDGEARELVATAAHVTESSDPMAAVLALVAARLLDLDWRSAPIDCTTTVRLRGHAPGTDIRPAACYDDIPRR